jgi:hypothetical protein
MARASVRAGHARDIAECLGQAVRSHTCRRAFRQAQLEARWPQIVGPAVARNCAPAGLSGSSTGGVLELMTSSAFAPRLAMIAPELVERVNRFLGGAAIARIRLRHGLPPAAPGGAADTAAAPEPPGAAAPAAVRQPAELRAIADPGLRAALERLAAALDASAGPPGFDPPPHRR